MKRTKASFLGQDLIIYDVMFIKYDAARNAPCTIKPNLSAVMQDFSGDIMCPSE